ncbi:MAG: hypothetical protein UX80_C0031G0004 [Candidatus Amesbacteria bacterium GW2011_GWA2_47_11b]|uniref:Glycosyltransferase RgtA/B/C/D-like domain-containing protein n=1 Tax=Candidatus Amesbacteria bacterium GW2011_GWA2_47_11b TaxID=1618358 RepID=A0A0G1TRM6_9BACT|nr:MAG: hypothetical protein UX80_C0031G0004 [Candidatus Amesbacteria bacterium GW2011_GWA2_47_11b]
MFTLAVFIGIYSYALAILGWLGRLGWGEIWGVTTVMLMVGLFHLRKFAVGQIGHIGLIGLIIAQAGVNLVGAMGPERGFDALWYHLPIPKIWLEAHKIFFIGGNLYYSAMPKLVDMLYVWGETPAKLMHLVFGLLSTAVTYKLARKWLEQKWALLAAVIFYSNLVVGWQSITAYIDLGRTFFEVLAFYLLVNKKIYKSAIVIGLAMATKIWAIGSLGILGVLVALGMGWRKSVKFVILALVVAAPWYVFAWASTGNPIYPIGSVPIDVVWGGINILRLADPINPIYVMVLPVIWMARKKIPVTIMAYCLLSFGMWYITPRTGGGRFLLPYLPVWSVAVAVVIKRLRDEEIKKFLVATVIALAVISIGYRAVANYGLMVRPRSSDLPVQLDLGRKT